MKKLLFILLFFSAIIAQTKISDFEGISILKAGDLFLITQDNTDVTPGKYSSKKLTYANLIAILQDTVFTKLDSTTYVRTFGEQLTIDGIKRFLKDIQTTTNKGIYSSNYISGLTSGSGWGIKSASQSDISRGGITAEFDNLLVRKNLFAEEFVVNKTRAFNGGLIVTDAATVNKVVSQTTGTFVSSDGSVIKNSSGVLQSVNYLQRAVIELVDVNNKDFCPFVKGDLFEIKKYYPGTGKIIATIRGEFVTVDGKRATVIYDTGIVGVGTTTLTVGDVIVRRGNLTDETRMGSIVMKINEPNTPYIDILDGVNTWAKINDGTGLKGRIGNIAGINSPTHGQLSGYGVYFPEGSAYFDAITANSVKVGSGNLTQALAIKLDTAGIGSLAFKDLADASDLTIIQGGKILSDYIAADSILTGKLKANQIEVDSLTAITTVGGTFTDYVTFQGGLSSSEILSPEFQSGLIPNFSNPATTMTQGGITLYYGLAFPDQGVYTQGTLSPTSGGGVLTLYGATGAGSGSVTVGGTNNVVTASGVVTGSTLVANDGYTGSFLDLDGYTITVASGIVKSRTAPAPQPAASAQTIDLDIKDFSYILIILFILYYTKKTRLV